MIAQIFNLSSELAIPLGMPTNEANAEIKTHYFHSLYHYVISLLKNNFLLYLFFILKSMLSIFVFEVIIYYLVILFIVIRRE